MKKRRYIAIAMLVLGTMGLVMRQALRQREPLYQGKPVSYWINRWGDVYAPWNVEHPDYDRKPLGWFPDADARAIPFLVSAMNRPNGLFGQSYPKVWLGAPPWARKRLPRPLVSGLIRVNAITALGQLGAAGKPAGPALLQALHAARPPGEKTAIALALHGLAAGVPLARTAVTEPQAGR